ncbi:MAG: type II secretion system F family protein [Anaerohalosphaeraceae bacterium]|nr:type II secretion system F family protein [Anaerohalosphaeraceae bacterium]
MSENILKNLMPSNSTAASNDIIRGKVALGELSFFASQLSVMLSSGVVLSEGVEAIAEQTKYGYFQDVLYKISDRLQNGESFSGALAAYPKIFDSMFVSVIEASEVSGQMPEMLDVLDDYLGSETETRKQIKGALVYPCIMMVVAVLATFTLMFFVLPKFTKIYESRGQALPKLTRMLVSVSKLASNWQSAVMTAAVIAAIVGGLYYWLKTVQGKRVTDYIKIYLPVLGNMFIDTIMTRSTRIMATMLNTGVPLLETLEVVKNSADNRYFRVFWTETCNRVEAGLQLSEAMKAASYSELVAPAILQMIRAGEKSGNLGPVCDRVSRFYDKKLKVSIKTVTTMIEPVMIIVMGVIIGTIAIALLLPIFKISSVVGH